MVAVFFMGRAGLRALLVVYRLSLHVLCHQS